MNIRDIRRYMLNKKGSKIVIKYFGSRNKIERYVGILDKLYLNIFTIKLLTGDVKSFSYSDILTKTIQIYI